MVQLGLSMRVKISQFGVCGSIPYHMIVLTMPTQDFGQKTLGHVTCKVCGMVYTFGQPDDQSEHFKFHRKFLSGVKFPVSLSEDVDSQLFVSYILGLIICISIISRPHPLMRKGVW